MSDSIWSGLQTNYTIIPNHIARDESLSIEARGLFALLASHAAGWKFNRTQLMKACSCGKEKFSRMIKELKEANILRIESTRGENGQITAWYWSISPTCLKNRNLDKAESDEPGTIRRTTKKEDQSKETPKPPKGADIQKIFEQILDRQTAIDWIADRKERKIKITERSAKMQVKKLAQMADPKAAIERSITNGWTGIFDEKKPNGRAEEPFKPQGWGRMDESERMELF